MKNTPWHQASQSIVKEAAKYAEELIITLRLDILNTVCVTTEGKVVIAATAGNLLKKSQDMQFLEIAKDKKWQGKLLGIRWEDESLGITSCFAWLKGWSTWLALHIPSQTCVTCMSSCYLRSSKQRRRRKPPSTAKSCAVYVGR